MATEYLLLQQDAESGMWEPLVTLEVENGGQRAVIRKAEIKSGGMYVAVPTRSWNPEEIEIDLEPKLRFKSPEIEEQPPPASPGEAVAAAPQGRPLAVAPPDDDGA